MSGWQADAIIERAHQQHHNYAGNVRFNLIATGFLRSLGLEPLARVASYASAGVEPTDMRLGPVAASRSTKLAGVHPTST